jgi:hypothetical protein
VVLRAAAGGRRQAPPGSNRGVSRSNAHNLVTVTGDELDRLIHLPLFSKFTA